jgi:hypothetical protein
MLAARSCEAASYKAVLSDSPWILTMMVPIEANAVAFTGPIS